MPALRKKKSVTGFGEIDPNAPFDAQRFFTALGATGNTPHVFYSIDDDKVRIEMDVCHPMTKLQKRRFANIMSWQQNKDPERQQQCSFVSNWVRSLPFAPRTEADGDGPRYFYYPLG